MLYLKRGEIKLEEEKLSAISAKQGNNSTAYNSPRQSQDFTVQARA